MPKFELSSDGLDISSIIKNMGITRIFDPDADFSPLTSDEIMVDSVLQSTRLKVDEEGLEGASYVAILMCGGLPPEDPPEPKEIVFDRPFVVAVLSPENLPLFVGIVDDPTA